MYLKATDFQFPRSCHGIKEADQDHVGFTATPLIGKLGINSYPKDSTLSNYATKVIIIASIQTNIKLRSHKVF